ncbi:MAG: aminotransferase class I/II-fold pyridoxal phosphate-dependent enzyme [Anaerolineae bacterium]|nr:aminotransferase class I/II-fold pyridoxal phosphate-dependent enzyme [Anaerolineae bacterium]
MERFKPLRFSRAGLRGLKVSATLSINEQVRQMWAEGREVYHLGFGESRFPVHPKIAEAFQANVQQRSYLPALGLRELRETIANYYQNKFQINVSTDRVVVGPGSKSLIYALLLALGEEIILPQPCWVSYAPQAHLLGKPVTWVPTGPHENYNLEISVLEQKIAESQLNWGNPEVLVINSPQNPTGAMMPPQRIEELADFAREQGLMIISDEIYALVTHGEIPHASIAQYYPEGSIVLGGLSKHLSLGGWRFGLAILPPGRAGRALRQALLNIASSIWSCVTAPVQYAALVAYSGDPEIEEYIELCTRVHGIRTQYLYDMLVELDIPCVKPTGAFYAFPSFKKWREPLAARGVHTSDELAQYLLDNYELATLPGTAFNCAPENLCLRLSSSYADAGTDKKAEKLLKVYQKNPDPERFIEDHHPRMHKIASRFADFINDLSKG